VLYVKHVKNCLHCLQARKKPFLRSKNVRTERIVLIGADLDSVLKLNKKSNNRSSESA